MPIYTRTDDGIIQVGTNSSYQVGDQFITSTNENPQDRLGGEWELADKHFRRYVHSNAETTSHMTFQNCTDQSCTALAWGHLVAFRLQCTTSTTLNDNSISLLEIDLSGFGVVQFEYSMYQCGVSDGGNGVIDIYFTNEGVVESRDVVTKTSGGSIASGSNFQVMVYQIVNKIDNMIDEFCDKFFWEKISD